MNLQEEYKKETNEEAMEDIYTDYWVYTTAYVEWLEAKVDKSLLNGVVKSLPTDEKIYEKACEYARNVQYPLNMTNIKLRQAFKNGAMLIKNNL